MVTGVTVANTLLMMAHNSNVSITHLKLQKLVYFIYRNFLQKTGVRLFTESFETWKHGPVLPSVYQEFSSFGSSDIDRLAQDAEGNVHVVDMEQSDTAREVICAVWGKYKYVDAWTLRNKTHQAGSAWSCANVRHSATISDDEINNDHVD